MKSLEKGVALNNHITGGGNALVFHNGDEVVGKMGLDNSQLKHGHQLLFPGRSLPSFRPSNHGSPTVIIPNQIKSRSLEILGHLRDREAATLPDEAVLGVSVDLDSDTLASSIQKELRAGNCELACKTEDARRAFYTIYSEQVAELALHMQQLDIPGSYEVSELFNNKVSAMNLCQKIGIRIPRSRIGFSKEEIEEGYASLSKEGVTKMILKGHGAAAFGNRFVDDDDSLQRGLLELSANLKPGSSLSHTIDVESNPEATSGLVLQERLPHVGSLGATMIVGSEPSNDRFVGMSQQEESAEGSNLGNVYPLNAVCSDSRVQQQVQSMLQKAANTSRLLGDSNVLLSADFIVCIEQGLPVVYLVEFNKRVTAQYGMQAMSHDLLGTTMPDDRYTFVGDVHLDAALPDTNTVGSYLTHLERTQSAYDPSTKTGIIPMSIPFRDTVQTVIFAQNEAEMAKLREISAM